MNDPLFVQLNSDPFRWFEEGDKDTELRGYGDRFNMETVYPGRDVRLVKGYDPANGLLHGTIEHVQHFDHAGNIPESMDYHRINPEAEDEEAFLDSVDDLLGDYSSYVAFQVYLETTTVRNDKRGAFLTMDALERQVVAAVGAGENHVAAETAEALFLLQSQVPEAWLDEYHAISEEFMVEEDAISGAMSYLYEWAREVGHPVTEWFEK